MKRVKKIIALVLCACMFTMLLSGCASVGNGKRIIRISHAQSESHPEHIGLLKFKEYIEENLGDKYEVQIYPNELLGGAQKAIELTQTGAIDFVVAGTANLETFADVYEIFSMPYLFTSEEAYHATMMDTEYMNNVYKSTDEAGFRVLTWYNAGSRSFYATKPIEKPEDLKGLKIRVQQSPASIKMANAFGAAASPMSFGEVYTAIQQGVINGAENNELALTNNKHGEVAKYYSYNRHQMVPDMLIGNLKFLNGLSDEELMCLGTVLYDRNSSLCKDLLHVVDGRFHVVGDLASVFPCGRGIGKRGCIVEIKALCDGIRQKCVLGCTVCCIGSKCGCHRCTAEHGYCHQAGESPTEKACIRGFHYFSLLLSF